MTIRDSKLTFLIYIAFAKWKEYVQENTTPSKHVFIKDSMILWKNAGERTSCFPTVVPFQQHDTKTCSHGELQITEC